MKNGVAYKNQDLNKHPLCNLGQYWSYIETSPLIYGANRWYGFYTMATLD